MTQNSVSFRSTSSRQKKTVLGVKTFRVSAELKMPQSSTDLRKGCLACVPSVAGHPCYTVGLDFFLSCWESVGVSATNASKQLPDVQFVLEGLLGLF